MVPRPLPTSSLVEFEGQRRQGYAVGALSATIIQFLLGLVYVKAANHQASALAFSGAALCLIITGLMFLPQIPLWVLNVAGCLLVTLWLVLDFFQSLLGGYSFTHAATLDLAILAVLLFSSFAARPSAWLIGGLYSLSLVGAMFNRHTDVMGLFPLGLLLLMIGLMSVYSSRLTTERARNEWLAELAFTDTLTGLPNRHAANVALLDAGKMSAVVLLDMDHFKKINEQVGHLGGDHVLIQVSAIMRDELKAPDRVFRWGGQEFLLLLGSAEMGQVKQITNTILARIHALQLTECPRLSLSAGAAHLSEADTPEEAVGLADQRLYTAKTTGRNKVVGR